MQVFKMLFESNVKRVLMLTRTHFTNKSFCRVDDSVINVLYNVFTSNKNCVISIKNGRQSGETTNLLAYAGVYCQTHCDKTVMYVVDNIITAQLLNTYTHGSNIMFVISRQFDFLIRGRKDVGLVIVDSQVSNVSDIIKHSCALKDTQFVISSDEPSIKFI